MNRNKELREAAPGAAVVAMGRGEPPDTTECDRGRWLHHELPTLRVSGWPSAKAEVA